ncbi:MAG: hypothetical protein QM736_00435 [Vicinamibacterales bacterium]
MFPSNSPRSLAHAVVVALAFAVIVSQIPLLGQIAVRNQGFVPFSDEPINYRADPDDPVARLQKRLDDGKVALAWEPRNGYLESVLSQLQIDSTSQMLVFSKTSFQYKKISPSTPRALYFNDDVYVGKVHGGKALELISFDAKQGAIFYLLDEEAQAKPRFQRAELDCTVCHVAPTTRNVPGVLVRSIYPMPTGTQALRTPAFLTGHDSPLSERFGGWYVTGSVGRQRHLGNVVVTDTANPLAVDREAGANIASLEGRIDTAPYLTPYSDVVAQLVHAHQTQAHNLMTLTNYQTRIALYEQAARNRAEGRPESEISPETRRRIEAPAEELVRYLLFAGESELTDAVKGSSGFAEAFAARGPRDRKGRSLRDFDLQTRLFRYPLSYLVYTDAFDALPDPARSVRLRPPVRGAHGQQRSRRILVARREGSPRHLRHPARHEERPARVVEDTRARDGIDGIGRTIRSTAIGALGRYFKSADAESPSPYWTERIGDS